MSLTAANNLQQLGRGDDSMLVHMTPREVAGLQAIAQMKGGSLTINPQTGLPEAGFLDDILPVAATAAMMYFAPGVGASIGSGLGLGTGALAQGVGMGLLAGGATALLTGDINKGLKTGLTAGALSGAMAGMAGPSTPEVPTANVETATPALEAAKGPQTWADMPGVSEGFTPGTNLYASDIAGPPKSAMVTPEKSFFGDMTGKQKLALGLGATGALSLLGNMGQKGISGVPADRGTIRPYQYTSAMAPAPAGQSPYFQPLQYGLDGRTTTPMDTSERNYFTQKFNALEPFKAAEGGMVPQLQRMPNGGLAAIEGMRDGYGAPMTTDGNIPQFREGGMPDSALRMMQEAKFNRDMPDELRDFIRAKRMGLLESGMVGEEQAALAGGKTPDFMFAPSGSPDLKTINAMAMLNKDLDEDTRLKLMATGYKNPEKKGIGTYGAGVTRKLGKDSDLSAFFEQSPDRSYQSYGARYSKRFNTGGGLPAVDSTLGGYSDGGRMLKGPGDGMSDDIPATINNKQPARLADGEFVVPADVVSHLGNGSTDAGAKRLYKMMDNVRKARTGTKKQGKQIKAEKYLPK